MAIATGEGQWWVCSLTSGEMACHTDSNNSAIAGLREWPLTRERKERSEGYYGERAMGTAQRQGTAERQEVRIRIELQVAGTTKSPQLATHSYHMFWGALTVNTVRAKPLVSWLTAMGHRMEDLGG
jgi:hypothetical protein